MGCPPVFDYTPEDWVRDCLNRVLLDCMIGMKWGYSCDILCDSFNVFALEASMDKRKFLLKNQS